MSISSKILERFSSYHHHMGRTRYPKGWNPHHHSSKYMPHYGKKETEKAVRSGRYDR